MPGAISLQGIYSWSWEAQTDQITVSSGARQLLCWPSNGFIGTRAAFAVHVNDLLQGGMTMTQPQVEKQTPSHPNDETLACALKALTLDAAPFDLEFKLKSNCTTPQWIQLTGQAEHALNGQLNRIWGELRDVSEQKNGVEHYRALSTQLAITLQSVTDPFFTLDHAWRFTYLNPAAEELLGRRFSDLMGKSLWVEFPQALGTEFQREYERAFAESVPVEFEAYYAPLQRWRYVKAYPSAQGLAVHFRDITQSRALQKALADSETRHRLLFEHSGDAMMEVLPDATVLKANAAACALFGMTEEEICAAGQLRMVAPEDRRLPNWLERYQKHGRPQAFMTGQWTMLRKGGERFEVGFSSTQYTTQDGTRLKTMTFRDITAALRHEQDMQARNAELDERVRQRTESLEKANSELKRIAYSLAHDLRQPITTIGGFSGRLQKLLAGHADEKVLHVVRRIQLAAHQMAQYQDALLALASITQVQLHLTEVDMSEIATSVLAALQAKDPQRAVNLSIASGLRGRGDYKLLSVVLGHLLGNAWKFTSKRAVADIALTVQTRSQEELIYCIRDNGAGFNPAYADKLFVNFQRLHSPEEFPGIGAGLAYVSRIIERHGGRVWAESMEGQGAAFFFTLEAGPH